MVMVMGVLIGFIVAALMFAGHLRQQRRKLKRLRAAAMVVLIDWRERDECYPGWYRQPGLLKVMRALVDATRETL